jgi:muramoyltetrapeptide carboxypeptidase LdcA involved in peptidoglycan recycling
VKNKITLPVGAEVELNTDQKEMAIRNMLFPGEK